LKSTEQGGVTLNSLPISSNWRVGRVANETKLGASVQAFLFDLILAFLEKLFFIFQKEEDDYPADDITAARRETVQ
jgi:hypothetical protein